MSNIGHAATNKYLINFFAYQIINYNNHLYSNEYVLSCDCNCDVTTIKMAHEYSSHKKMGFWDSSLILAGFWSFLHLFPPFLPPLLLPCTSDKSRASSGSFGAHKIGSYTHDIVVVRWVMKALRRQLICLVTLISSKLIWISAAYFAPASAVEMMIMIVRVMMMMVVAVILMITRMIMIVMIVLLMIVMMIVVVIIIMMMMSTFK